MLVEMAIADAYGAAFEFVEKPYPNGLVNDGETFHKHPVLEIGNGRYTDDTQMAIAITEEILDDGPFTKESLTNRFFTAFKRDPRPGYGKRFYALLQECETAEELLARIDPNSTRSGAVMRVGPVGLYPDLDEVLEKARLQAQVTHDTKEAIMAAQAIAASTHFFLHQGGAVKDLGTWLEGVVPGHGWSMDWREWASVQALPVAHAAITALRLGSTDQDVMQIAVDLGGDVDTTATLAVWLAGFTVERAGAFPQRLYDDFENGPFGLHFLHDLDDALFRKFKLLTGR